MGFVVFLIVISFIGQFVVSFLFVCGAASLLRLLRRSTGSFPYRTCLLIAALFSVPATVLEVSRKLETSRNGVADAVDADKPYGDRIVLEEIGGHARRFHNAVAVVLRDYRDPNLLGDQWLQKFDSQLVELQGACDDMTKSAMTCEDSGAASTCVKMAGLFTQQKDCWIAIRDAVAAEDQDAEEKAFATMTRISEEKQLASREFLERLSKWIPQDKLDQALERRRLEVEEKMRPTE